MQQKNARIAPLRGKKRLAAGLVVLLLSSSQGLVEGSQGDCSQPLTTGASPTASDCLYILKTATGANTCTPACICNTNGIGNVTASDSLLCLRAAVGQPAELDCPCVTTTLATSTTTVDGGSTTTIDGATTTTLDGVTTTTVPDTTTSTTTTSTTTTTLFTTTTDTTVTTLGPTTTTSTTTTTLEPAELIAELENKDSASVLAQLLPAGLSFGLSYGSISIVPGLGLATITGSAYVGFDTYVAEGDTATFDYDADNSPGFDAFVDTLTNGLNDSLQRSAVTVTLGSLITLPASTKASPEASHFSPLTDLSGYDIEFLRLIVNEVELSFGVFTSASWDVTWQFWGRPN